MSNETRSSIKDRIRGRYLFLLIPGILFLLLGLVTIALTIYFVNSAVATEGTVVEAWSVPSGSLYKDSYDYYAKVEFRTSGGKLVRFEEKYFIAHVGDKVKVLYDPSNQFEPRVYTVWWFWGVWSLLAAFGAACFVAGLWGWISKRKLQKESRLKTQVN